MTFGLTLASLAVERAIFLIDISSSAQNATFKMDTKPTSDREFRCT
jgi:hypothetical protein